MPLADTSEISLEELQLAARNHGMPLEALRWPVTPAGLHYLLIHYDVPVVDPASWRLEVGGLVERPLSLTLDDLRARPAVEHAVTMECAGNGRARLTPRPVSQPWLHEAVGTAVWGGTPLAGLLEEAGLRPDAVEVRLHRARPRHRGRRGAGLPAQPRPPRRAMPDVLLAWEMNGAPLLPQHGFPLRLVVPGWYGMTSVKWLASVEVVAEPFRGYQMTAAYRYRDEEDEEGEPVTRIAAARADGAARDPGLLHARAHRAARAGRARGPRLVGRSRRSPASRSAPTARRGTRRSSSATSTAAGRGAAGRSRGSRPARANTSCHAARATRRETCSRTTRRGTSAATPTTACSASP